MAQPLLLLLLLHTADASVIFRALPGGGFEFSNDLIRTQWSSDGNQTYDINTAAASIPPTWFTLADSGGGIEVQQKAFADNSSWTTRQRLAIPGLDHDLPPPLTISAAPTATSTDFTVTGNATSTATLRFNLTLGPRWLVHVALTLNAGDHYIHERLAYTRIAAAASAALSHLNNVRVGKHFHTSGIPSELQLSFWRSVGYAGWAWPNASFVVQALGSWSPQSGGGAFPDPEHWSGNKIHIGPEFSVVHRAPPARADQSERIEWISLNDVGVGEAYVLEHNVVIRPGYHFAREFLEYLWALDPPQKLAPRFSKRHMVEKMLFALQYTPDEEGVVGGAFREYSINASGVVNGTGERIAIGFIAQAWYNFLREINDPNGEGANFTLLIQHSPDWGAGMDAWSCLFMLLYKEAYGDTPDRFINRTTTKMINGFVHLPWNLEKKGSLLNGAMWEAWDEKKGMHPANFLGPNEIFWLCDSGKSGYMFLRLYELTGSTNVGLLKRAEAAARFLLRIQLPSGDFAGSVYSAEKNGAPLRPPNYAATTSAILLWAKLYQVTHNATWLNAAEAAAAAVGSNYLQPGSIQINGGELDDVMVNDGSRPGGLNVHGISGGTYGVMGLSELVKVTQKPEHIALVRISMDYMLAWQWTRDINVGYYNSKARFQGMDMKTTGAAVNGMVRSEMTMYSWMAYEATGDAKYYESFKHSLNWLTYQQYDNIYETRFYGGGDEGLAVSFQYVNGLGCNFFGETTGQGVGIMLHLLSLKEEHSVLSGTL